MDFACELSDSRLINCHSLSTSSTSEALRVQENPNFAGGGIETVNVALRANGRWSLPRNGPRVRLTPEPNLHAHKSGLVAPLQLGRSSWVTPRLVLPEKLRANSIASELLLSKLKSDARIALTFGFSFRKANTAVHREQEASPIFFR